MQDRYTFRFWNKEINKWFYFVFNTFYAYTEEIHKIVNNAVMIYQSTGKKDKHNNLIFEGDILKETYFSEDTDSLTSCLYKVEFDKEVSAFCFTELDGGYKNYLCNFDYKPEDYEIIGSTYTMPENIK